MAKKTSGTKTVIRRKDSSTGKVRKGHVIKQSNKTEKESHETNPGTGPRKR
jgi:hypothetical protein